MQDDRDLHERFAELRREDQARTGQFQALLERARPRAARVRVSPWIAAAAGLAVMIAVVVMAVHRSGPRDVGRPEVSITEWKSPTDFLLRTPGEEVLRTIPRIGEWPASTETPGGSRKSPATRKKNLTKIFSEEDLS